MITYERASELFDYNPDTGDLTWKVSRGCISAGSVAGSKKYHSGDTPLQIGVGIDCRCYGAHRIAWLLYYGAPPRLLIDHINGNPFDNRICNLREATTSQNGRNRGLQKNNASGFKGVWWNAEKRKWRAGVCCAGKRHCLGYYDTPEEAHKAYCKKARELHGDFVNTGEQSETI